MLYEHEIRAGAFQYMSLSLEGRVRAYNEARSYCAKRGRAIPQPASFGISTLEVWIECQSGALRRA